MIELLVFDVDGCLTDGKIVYTNEGEEVKSFSVKDGLAIASWIRMGKKAAIITGRRSKIVERRAAELGITHLFQGVKKKAEKLEEILKEEGLDWDNVAAIGDDLNDISMLRRAGWSFTPADGVSVIKDEVDTVLATKGGEGAAREMIDSIIEKEELGEEFMALWL